mmetsp:Transcript_26558/g.30738  ORF Transcript_26558/g.30738 Transcript_26558/m.30738 type:complete len:92 (-) Transcript_26558:23-298(-)
MPRAYYKPFTMYEDIVGFRTINRFTKFLMGGLFGLLGLKMVFFTQFNNHIPDEELTPEQLELLANRADLASKLSSSEAMRKSMRERRLPPA